MKINLYGSNANMAYLLAKFLRRKRHQADVFIDHKPEYKCNFPSWEEGEDAEFDSWVKPVDINFKRIGIGRRERQFLRNLSNCDIIHVIGEAGIWASFTGRPYLYWSYGFDLDLLPFKNKGIKERLLSYLQRRTLKKAEIILYPMPHQSDIVKKLGLRNSEFFLPMVPIDTDKYSKRNTPELADLRASFNCRWLFLHPSRQEWQRDIPDNKGNQRLFKAFASFIKTGASAKLIAFEKGNDTEQSKQLCSNLGITDKVIWLKQSNKEILIELYSISDIVFDQFNIGSPGLITWESLSIGVPTFVYMNQDWNSCCDELPPVINVQTENELLKEIIRLTSDPEELKELGRRSREWIIKYFHWEKVIDQYIEYYQRILNQAPKKGKEVS